MRDDHNKVNEPWLGGGGDLAKFDHDPTTHFPFLLPPPSPLFPSHNDWSHTWENTAVKLGPHGNMFIPRFWFYLDISSCDWLQKDMGNHGVLICITSKNLKNKRKTITGKKNRSEFQKRTMQVPLVMLYGDWRNRTSTLSSPQNNSQLFSRRRVRLADLAMNEYLEPRGKTAN